MPLKPGELRPLTPGLNLACCLCQWQNNVFNKFPGRSYAAWKMHSFNMFICITDLSFGGVYYSLCKLIPFPASNEMHIRKGSQRLLELKRPSSVCFLLQSPPTSFPAKKQLERCPKPFKNKSSGIDKYKVLFRHRLSVVLCALWLSCEAVFDSETNWKKWVGAQFLIK